MTKFIVSKDVEVILNGSKYLLQKGDVISIEDDPEGGGDMELAGKVGDVMGGFPKVDRSNAIIGHSRKTTPRASTMR